MRNTLAQLKRNQKLPNYCRFVLLEGVLLYEFHSILTNVLTVSQTSWKFLNVLAKISNHRCQDVRKGGVCHFSLGSFPYDAMDTIANEKALFCTIAFLKPLFVRRKETIPEKTGHTLVYCLLPTAYVLGVQWYFIMTCLKDNLAFLKFRDV